MNRPKLYIRDFMWLMVLVACMLGSWIPMRRLQQDNLSLRDDLDSALRASRKWRQHAQDTADSLRELGYRVEWLEDDIIIEAPYSPRRPNDER